MRRTREGESIRVFMLGWEFPPFISGGLGTACYGLTRAMDQLGMKVTFVLPRQATGDYATHVKLLTPAVPSQNVYRLAGFKHVRFRTIPSSLQPYATSETYAQQVDEILKRGSLAKAAIGAAVGHRGPHYGQDMYSEVHRYASVAVDLALAEDFDVIHAHDWMTYPAGIAVAAATGRPLVVHVHSTEFDRSGEHVNQTIYDIERAGMERADRIIAVSYYTRSIVMSRYGVPGDKVEVVYNAVDRNGGWPLSNTGIKRDENIVLFLGRITMQKGPEYFLMAAKKVTEVMGNVKFVMAGSGDMMHRAINMAAELGIGHKVLFTGFLRGDEVRQIYRMADLYVMPSVSEPFGIAPLEALENDVPVIISRQSGVSEVLTHALKVDFWDVNEIANKIVAVLRHRPLQLTLRDHGSLEARKLRWSDSARKCQHVYEEMMVLA